MLLWPSSLTTLDSPGHRKADETALLTTTLVPTRKVLNEVSQSFLSVAYMRLLRASRLWHSALVVWSPAVHESGHAFCAIGLFLVVLPLLLGEQGAHDVVRPRLLFTFHILPCRSVHLCSTECNRGPCMP